MNTAIVTKDATNSITTAAITIATGRLDIKPLYMWAGGKTKLLNKHYQGRLPAYGQFTTYIEPFLGGGAVFCDVVNSDEIDNFVINDINPEIISIYQAIKSDVEAFIAMSETLANEWNTRSEAERKTWYYDLRKQYWSMETGTLATSATLYVLMKTSFNGVWQTNKGNKGLFGTAAGLLNKKAKIAPDLIRAWSAKLQSTTITCMDYRKMTIPATPCLIYLDPPYRGSFTSYGQDFDDQAQKDLVEWSRDLSVKGHTVILANRDCKDGFFDEILADATSVHHFDVTYTVGRKKKTNEGYEAKDAIEFIAVFEGKERSAANDEVFCDEAVSFNGVKTVTGKFGTVAANDACAAPMQKQRVTSQRGLSKSDDRCSEVTPLRKTVPIISSAWLRQADVLPMAIAA